MKLRTSLAAAGAAVALGTTGALVVPAVASAHSTTTTLKFVSEQKASARFGKTAGGEQDTDVNAAGKTVGFDMLYFAVTSANTGSVNATIDTTGGFLYGTFKYKAGATTDGKVTGGTGAFAGATGTITAKNLNKAGTRTAVSITYST